MAVFLALLGPSLSSARVTAVGGADRQGIVSVIQSQLNAFVRDDGVAAFSYASPRIRQRFGTPQNFMAMVRGGYPAVYRPREIEFLETQTRDGHIFQPVRFVGPDGEAVIALYEMERQIDGTWKINGVYLVPTGELTS